MRTLLCCALAIGLSGTLFGQFGRGLPGQGGVKRPSFPPPFAGPSSCPQGATNLCIPLDGSFIPVDMNQVGWSDPADPNDYCQRNDDDSGGYALNGWGFKHFGTLYTTVYINNNGNLSFGTPFSTFTPTGFPVSGFPMVAPFWGDVDTGDMADTFGGVVWMREESVANGDAVNRLTVIWDHVGCYDEIGTLLNTFEVIITDGADPSVGIGNNVCFCYDDMVWTTGDASGGNGGFGGAPATVGANQGNGTDFFQIGTFDHQGVDYDGPSGVPDGVDWLDNTTFCFDISALGSNVPPVWLNPPGQCLQIDAGNQLQFTLQATGPEIGQIVAITENHGALANFTCTPVSGNPATATCSFTPDVTQLGSHSISFTATDDATPALTSLLDICIEVSDPAGNAVCFGDGSGTACPCDAGASGAGCKNTSGVGATLTATGNPSLSADTFALAVSGVPGGKPGVLLVGLSLLNGGVGSVMGDGILCASPSMRSQVIFANSAGNVDITNWRGLPFGSYPGVANPGVNTYYQWWYRDPSSTCTGTGFNYSNAWQVTWQ